MSPGQLARLSWLCLTHVICCPLSTAGSIDLALGSLFLGCPPYPFCWYIPGMFGFVPLSNLGSWAWCEPVPCLGAYACWRDRRQRIVRLTCCGFLLACPWEGRGSHRLFEMPCHVLVRKMSREGGTGSLPIFLLEASHCFRRPLGWTWGDADQLLCLDEPEQMHCQYTAPGLFSWYWHPTHQIAVPFYEISAWWPVFWF